MTQGTVGLNCSILTRLFHAPQNWAWWMFALSECFLCSVFSLLAIFQIVSDCDCHYDIFLSHIHSPPRLPVSRCDRTRCLASSISSIVAPVYCFCRWSIDINSHIIVVLESWTVQQNISCKRMLISHGSLFHHACFKTVGFKRSLKHI